MPALSPTPRPPAVLGVPDRRLPGESDEVRYTLSVVLYRDERTSPKRSRGSLLPWLFACTFLCSASAWATSPPNDAMLDPYEIAGELPSCHENDPDVRIISSVSAWAGNRSR